MRMESAKDGEDCLKGDGGGASAGMLVSHTSSRPYSEIIKCRPQWNELIAKYRFGHHVGHSKYTVKCGSRSN